MTSAGTLALGFATGQAANQVLASPDGTTGAVGLRAHVATDISSLPAAQITSGTLSLLSLSGITTAQLDPAAGLVAGQITTVKPPALTGSGTIPQAANIPTMAAAALIYAASVYR